MNRFSALIIGLSIFAVGCGSSARRHRDRGRHRTGRQRHKGPQRRPRSQCPSRPRTKFRRSPMPTRAAAAPAVIALTVTKDGRWQYHVGDSELPDQRHRISGRDASDRRAYPQRVRGEQCEHLRQCRPRGRGAGGHQRQRLDYEERRSMCRQTGQPRSSATARATTSTSTRPSIRTARSEVSFRMEASIRARRFPTRAAVFITRPTALCFTEGSRGRDACPPLDHN